MRNIRRVVNDPVVQVMIDNVVVEEIDLRADNYAMTSAAKIVSQLKLDPVRAEALYFECRDK